MSAVIYAKHVRCDWPGCQSEAEVTLGPEWPDRTLPAGWTDLRQVIMIRQPGSIDAGRDISEVCSIHSLVTLAQLAEALIQKVAADVS